MTSLDWNPITSAPHSVTEPAMVNVPITLLYPDKTSFDDQTDYVIGLIQKMPETDRLKVLSSIVRTFNRTVV
jgi:formate dehydrogenase maturation protein FdhE